MSQHKAHINCPNCGTSIDVEQVLGKEAESRVRKEFANKEAELRQQMEQRERQLQADREKFEENRKLENDKFMKKLQDELAKKEISVRQEEERKLQEQYSLQFQAMQQELERRKLEATEAKKLELDIMRERQMLQEKQEQLELDLQKRLLESRQGIEEEVRKRESERSEMKILEMTKKMEDQKKLIDEMQRKAEQGSMQLQGEVQELALEEMLKHSFPFDKIEEVGKGVRGADVIQSVYNQYQDACGKIIYESKRTKAFSQAWIEKLKQDLRGQQADIAVIVTETMPLDMPHFGLKDGVWICTFQEIKGLSMVLRDGLIRVHQAMSAQENKGDKMHMLYDFLTGNEFRQQMEAIVEGFTSMQMSIAKEKVAMQKIWSEREKQIEKVLLNTSKMYGSVRGIAGNAIQPIQQFELPSAEE